MANILLCECFNGGNGQYEQYRQMLNLCGYSFDLNLKGEWHWQVLQPEGVVPPQEMFKRILREELALVRSGHNVFRVGIDMLCLKPTTVFGQYPLFSFFGVADPFTNPHWTLAAKSQEFQKYLCGAYYWPSNTPAELLSLAETLANDWNDSVWDYCQWIYNKVFWSQGPDVAQYIDPRLSFQKPPSGTPDNQGVGFESAHIVHYHATRGQGDVLRAMQADWSQYGS